MTPEHERAFWLHKAEQEEAAGRIALAAKCWLLAQCCQLRAAQYRAEAEKCKARPWWKRIWRRAR